MALRGPNASAGSRRDDRSISLASATDFAGWREPPKTDGAIVQRELHGDRGTKLPLRVEDPIGAMDMWRPGLKNRWVVCAELVGAIEGKVASTTLEAQWKDHVRRRRQPDRSKTF